MHCCPDLKATGQMGGVEPFHPPFLWHFKILLKLNLVKLLNAFVQREK